MDSPLKQRLIGAAVLAALAIIFLPMLLKGPDVKEPDAAEVPLSMPATPAGDFETRELPLTAPEENTPPGGVLGMPKGAQSPEQLAQQMGIAPANVAFMRVHGAEVKALFKQLGADAGDDEAPAR